MNTSIAIIIPVFNLEKYIEETLISIIGQTSSPDEIIVIDDGSSDNSDLILNNFIKYPGFRKFRTTNHGCGEARNIGRTHAKSEYLYFLDGDDIINKDFISDMRFAINKYNNPDMILFSGETFSEISSPNKEFNLKFTLSGQFTRRSRLISKLINKKEAFPQVGRYISKNSLWTINKINYPSIICEDEGVFLPLLAFSKNTVVLPKVYLKYRTGRAGSDTGSKPYLKFLASNLYMINLISQFMKKHPLLVENDISAWRYRLGRNGLKYTAMCIKTKTPIKWSIIFTLLVNVKSVVFIFKIVWRIIKMQLKFKS